MPAALREHARDVDAGCICGRERAGLARVERRQPDLAHAAFAREPAHEPQRRRIIGELAGPSATRDAQQLRGARRARDEVQQRRGRLVDPLHVVDHEHEAAGSRARREPLGDRFEQAPALELGGRGERMIVRVSRGERVEPRAVRPHLFGFDAAAAQHRQLARARERRHLVEQAALADARIAEQQHELARRCGDELAQRGELLRATDERRRRRELDARRARGGQRDHDRRAADRHAQPLELARRRAAELALEQPRRAGVLRERFGLAIELDERADHRRVRRFVERIERDPRACVRENVRSIASARGEARDQRRQHGDAEPARGLALGAQPFVVAIAIRQIEPFEQLAAHERRDRRERVGRRAGHACGRTARHRGAQAREIDRGTDELDAIAIRDQPRLVVVDERAQLRQTPAQRRARIIGTVPQQRAQPLAQLRLAGRRQIREQRARLLRGR